MKYKWCICMAPSHETCGCLPPRDKRPDLSINRDLLLAKTICVQIRRHTKSFNEALKMLGKAELYMEEESRHLYGRDWGIDQEDLTKELLDLNSKYT